MRTILSILIIIKCRNSLYAIENLHPPQIHFDRVDCIGALAMLMVGPTCYNLVGPISSWYIFFYLKFGLCALYCMSLVCVLPSFEV